MTERELELLEYRYFANEALWEIYTLGEWLESQTKTLH
jgi:hypothetical protein